MKCNSTCLEVLNADILIHGETSRKIFAFFFVANALGVNT